MFTRGIAMPLFVGYPASCLRLEYKNCASTCFAYVDPVAGIKRLFYESFGRFVYGCSQFLCVAEAVQGRDAEGVSVVAPAREVPVASVMNEADWRNFACIPAIATDASICTFDANFLPDGIQHGGKNFRQKLSLVREADLDPLGEAAVPQPVTRQALQSIARICRAIANDARRYLLKDAQRLE